MGHKKKPFCHSMTADKPGLHQVCQNFKKFREKIKLEHVFNFLGREMVDSLFIECTSWVFLHSWKLKQVEKLEKEKIRAYNFMAYNTVWKQLLSVLYCNQVKYPHTSCQGWQNKCQLLPGIFIQVHGHFQIKIVNKCRKIVFSCWQKFWS
jgi:hypothetical protein